MVRTLSLGNARKCLGTLAASILLALWAIVLGICHGCSRAEAQWGSGRCAPGVGPVGPSAVQQRVVITSALRWGPCAGSDCQVALFRGDVQVGNWCHARRVYCPYDAAAGTWGAPCSPPIAPPAPPPALAAKRCGCCDRCPCRDCCCADADQPCCPTCMCCCPDDDTAGGDLPPEAVEEPVVYDGGLIQSELSKTASETIWLGTRKISLERALQSIESVPDYRAKPRLCVTGSESQRMALHAAAKSAGLLDTYVWSDCSPEHWHLRDRDGKAGFKTDAQPVLYVQAPDGRVTARMDNVQPSDLAKLRVQPPYDPSKDPDPRKPPAPPPGPAPGPLPSPAGVPTPSMLALIGAAALGLLFFLSRQQPR